MRHLDLFSGIGGFALAARNVGWETVAFCEIDPFCRRVLNKHWPSVPIHEDVRIYDGAQADIITGGFPCQDFSRLGKRSGMEGEHSGLWSEFARIIHTVLPRFVLVENVPEMLVHGMGRVIGDLASIGYDAEWFGIPAAAVGANHLRARQWILAYPAGFRDGMEENPICAGWVASKYSDWWASEPQVRRVDDGIPGRVDRLRALGNAIVPQIAEGIYRAINSVPRTQ